MKTFSAQTFPASLLLLFVLSYVSYFLSNLSVGGLSLSVFLFNIGLFHTVMIDSLRATMLLPAFSISSIFLKG